MKRHEQGRRAEQQACGYLRQHGLELIEANYRCRLGEIDLIMRDGQCTVFVEVRLRRDPAFGGGLASVNHRKQAKLIAAARQYLQSSRTVGAARFDVIAIGADDEIEWVRNAIEANS